MEKKWHIKNGQESSKIEALRAELKVDRIVAELLLQRGIDDFKKAQEFFRPDLNNLHDPFLMKDMDKAVARIAQAIKNKERVLLFGDYDVDGTTAVALLFSILKEYLHTIEYYIPDRYSEGYGISFQGIDFAYSNKQTLIIALDCGIKANDKVAYAKEKGIDFIICDHHEPGEELPTCIVLDPKRKDCLYPFKELSGCGVGFKFLQGFLQKSKIPLTKLFNELDLVAISIGADIVPIVAENRILCFHGLKLLNAKPRIAFQKLLDLAGKEMPLSLTDVVFIIAPRINAAGRLRSGKMAVELMISSDLNELKHLALEINSDNTERKGLDQQISKEALQQIENDLGFPARCSTVVFDPSWHKGVVGIVASRLIEKHYRPTIVLTESEGIVSGSARSVRNFDLYKALLSCEDLLEQFGGHTFAAGLSMKIENLEIFKSRFEEYVENNLALEDRIPTQALDISIDLNEIHGNESPLVIPRMKRIIEDFEPHGPGNMKPVFYSSNLYSTEVRVLKEAHLKLKVTQANSRLIYDAIGFNMALKENQVARGLPFEMAYTLETNEYKDKKMIQFNIKDIREQIQ
jgi:single-stranded-DNA-specific exonuclease